MDTQTVTNGQGPSVAKAEPTPPTVTVKREQLRDALRLTIGHASKDVTKPHIAGVLLEIPTGRTVGALRLVSTDGHRLALADIEADGGGVEGVPGTSVLLSLQNAKQLRDAVKYTGPQGALPCGLTLEPGRLTALITSTTGMSKLALGTVLDEKFPPYAKVMPEGESRKADWSGNMIGLNAGYLADAARLLKPFAHDKSGGVKVQVYSDRDPVRIDAQNPKDMCEATVIIMPMRI